jgi:hypothetical protein
MGPLSLGNGSLPAFVGQLHQVLFPGKEEQAAQTGLWSQMSESEVQL